MTKPRPRRSTEEIRRLILEAARDLFGTNGYAGTSTRSIARQADVSENLLFSNFGNKEQLFQAAVIEPIDEFLREYTESWLTVPLVDADPDEEIRSFVAGLYDLARQHRTLLLAAPPGQLGPGAQRALGRLEHMAGQVAKLNGYAFEPRIAIRAAVTMVTTMALFEEPLYDGDMPAREEVIGQLTAILQRGLIQALPPTDAPQGP